MSKTSIREVDFYDAKGNLVKTVTDAETARQIGQYKDTYNKIKSFVIMSYTVQTKQILVNSKFDCNTLVARSPRMQIMCIKEYMSGMPEFMNGAQYACRITNVKTGKHEDLTGGVAALYYDLFRGRVK